MFLGESTTEREKKDLALCQGNNNIEEFHEADTVTGYRNLVTTDVD